MQRDVTLIVGASGTGKTTLARSMLRELPRVVVFDPTRDLARSPGFAFTESLTVVGDLIRQHWQGGQWRIGYTPTGDVMAAASDLARNLMTMQYQSNFEAHGRGLTLVIDEMDQSYPATPMAADRDGMVRATLQGRHAGISLIGITQRPSLVNASFRSNANRTMILKMHDYTDRELMRRVVGPENVAQLDGLQPFQFLTWAGGQLSGPAPVPKL